MIVTLALLLLTATPAVVTPAASPSPGMSRGEPQPPFTHTSVAAPPPADRVKVGGELYSVHCISCHGAQLEGTATSPGLRAAGAASVDFQLSTGRMPLEVPGTEPMRGPPSTRARRSTR